MKAFILRKSSGIINRLDIRSKVTKLQMLFYFLTCIRIVTTIFLDEISLYIRGFLKMMIIHLR